MSTDTEAVSAVEESTEPVHILRELSHEGDTMVTWRPGVAAEVSAARAHFDALKAKGYLAYSVGADRSQGELVRRFDPELGEIIMSPQVIGG